MHLALRTHEGRCNWNPTYAKSCHRLQSIVLYQHCDGELKTRDDCADDYREGALAVLRRCVNERLKIKVWTRNYGYVRGICVGYVVAFDKHWNLVCVPVSENKSFFQ